MLITLLVTNLETSGWQGMLITNILCVAARLCKLFSTLPELSARKAVHEWLIMTVTYFCYYCQPCDWIIKSLYMLPVPCFNTVETSQLGRKIKI